MVEETNVRFPWVVLQHVCTPKRLGKSIYFNLCEHLDEEFGKSW